MIRFTLPSCEFDRQERINRIDEQIESFLKSDSYKRYLNILGIEEDCLIDVLRELKKNDTRLFDNGVFKEAQHARVNEKLENHRIELYEVFRDLGWISINTPLFSDFRDILILGGSYTADYNRTIASKRHIVESVESINALGCYRPISPKEINRSVFDSKSDTEFGVFNDAVVRVFNLEENDYDEEYISDRNINKIANIRTFHNTGKITFRVFASPSSRDNERASTYDTYIHYLKTCTNREKRRILAITNNRYCNLQCLEFCCAVLDGDFKNVDFDIVGINDNDHITSIGEYDPTQYSNDLISVTDWIVRFKKRHIWV